MITNEASTQIAHALLAILSRHKTPTFRMFYEDYRALFSPVKVPAIKTYNLGEKIGFVDIDCQQGITYLKERYNFVTSQELQQILVEESQQFQE
jgi:hypothetical protein